MSRGANVLFTVKNVKRVRQLASARAVAHSWGALSYGPCPNDQALGCGAQIQQGALESPFVTLLESQRLQTCIFENTAFPDRIVCGAVGNVQRH